MTLIEKRQGVYEGDECLVCHRRPAQKTTVQWFRSILIVAGGNTLIAPLCRDHAVELTNDAFRHTLIGGWWGVGLLVMPMMIPLSLRRISRAKKIPPPEGELRLAEPQGTSQVPDTHIQAPDTHIQYRYR